MATITYLNSATNETYSEEAFGYISNPRVRDSIISTSATLGISAGAIAGAMAEENTAYDWKDGNSGDGNSGDSIPISKITSG